MSDWVERELEALHRGNQAAHVHAWTESELNPPNEGTVWVCVVCHSVSLVDPSTLLDPILQPEGPFVVEFRLPRFGEWFIWQDGLLCAEHDYQHQVRYVIVGRP